MCKKILIPLIPFNFINPYIPRNVLQGKKIIVLFRGYFCLLTIQNSNYHFYVCSDILVYISEFNEMWNRLFLTLSGVFPFMIFFLWYLLQEREIIIYHYSCEDDEILINAMFLLFKLITINVFWRPYLPLSSGFCLVSTFW